MKKISFILLLLSASFAFFSCSEDLIKADFDYTQDPLKISSNVSLDLLEKASDEEIRFKATITPSNDIVYDQGLIYSSSESFDKYEVISVQPETTATGIIMEEEAYGIPQGVTYYFKAFVLTKEGLAVSAEVKSIFLPITWENVGRVIVIESLFQTEAEVVIQKFLGENRYRLVGLYSAIWEELDPEDEDIPQGRDKTLVFYLDDDANAEGLPAGLQDLGMGVYGYEFFWALPGQPYANYCSFTNKANKYRIEAIRAVDGAPAYTFWLEFEWIVGYPGEIPEPEADYSAEIAYIGRFTDLGGDDYALADVALGADVAYAKVALVPGNITNAALMGIIDGSIESQLINADGTVSVPCTDTGIYTFIVITYDEDDEPQEYEYATFDFYSSKGGTSTVAIEDFYGNYKLTGSSQWAGDPDADMDVTIAAGAAANTLIITGIDLAAEVEATFDPATGTISIEPQELADYGPYDITLYTTTPDGAVSATAAMTFSISLIGNLVMTPTSAADGYLLRSEAAGGYVDGYYDLVFTPKSGSTSASAMKSFAPQPKLQIKAKELERVSVGTKVSGSKEIFVITKGTGSAKKVFRQSQMQSVPII